MLSEFELIEIERRAEELVGGDDEYVYLDASVAALIAEDIARLVAIARRRMGKAA